MPARDINSFAGVYAVRVPPGQFAYRRAAGCFVRGRILFPKVKYCKTFKLASPRSGRIFVASGAAIAWGEMGTWDEILLPKHHIRLERPSLAGRDCR